MARFENKAGTGPNYKGGFGFRKNKKTRPGGPQRGYATPTRLNPVNDQG